jgi:acyl carrier protein phosphodiesterase
MITMERILRTMRKCKTYRDFNRMDEALSGMSKRKTIDINTYIQMSWYISGIKFSAIRGLKL